MCLDRHCLAPETGRLTEDGPGRDVRRGLDTPAMRFDDSPADRQADAGAAFPGGPERLEQMLLVPGREADAVAIKLPCASAIASSTISFRSTSFTLWRLVPDKAPHPLDRCGRAVRVAEDPLGRRARLFETGQILAQPSQAGIAAADDAGQRLVDFMCDRSGELAEIGHPRDPDELSPRIMCRGLGRYHAERQQGRDADRGRTDRPFPSSSQCPVPSKHAGIYPRLDRVSPPERPRGSRQRFDKQWLVASRLERSRMNWPAIRVSSFATVSPSAIWGWCWQRSRHSPIAPLPVTCSRMKTASPFHKAEIELDEALLLGAVLALGLLLFATRQYLRQKREMARRLSAEARSAQAGLIRTC